MKIKILFLFVFYTCLTNAQKINLTYDLAGNQIKRSVLLFATKNTLYKTPETLKDNDFIIENKISYYPNPVREELYLNWKNELDRNIDNIEVYNMNGQLMKTYNNLVTIEIATIGFQNYTDGVYNLILNYENGEKKILKIVKK